MVRGANPSPSLNPAREIVVLYHIAEQRLARLFNTRPKELLQGGRIGLEKESLRVSPEGTISQKPHPGALGSALTHPYITTDYSEALIEFITPPFADTRESLQFLCDTQTFVYSKLEDELLWATSMPCVLTGESSIPIARYGKSNAGIMKTVYRRGLGYRYSQVMQVIAGVHFNYSLPEVFWPVFQDLEQDTQPLRNFIADAYFALIRNLQRFGWLIPYLFGASPAVCKSFLGGKATDMQEFDANTYYEPYATSLRMGDIGYQNKKEDRTGIKACYDNLDAYVASLTYAIETPCPLYENMGVVVDGEYRQLNTNILQIENEYYSSIRPKQLAGREEKPTHALKRRGVRYVELRSLDVNAFDPLGIHEDQLRFLEAFLVFCLFHESPPIRAREGKEIDENQSAAAHRGRDPSLRLQRCGDTPLLRDWAAELCEAMQGVCEYLDAGEADQPYSKALEIQREAIRDPDKTPSARMLAEMWEKGEGFYQFAKRMSQEHQRYFNSRRLSDERSRFFTEAARRSLQAQKKIEAADEIAFDEYLRRYFAQTL